MSLRGGVLTRQLSLTCDLLSGRNCCGVVGHLVGYGSGGSPGEFVKVIQKSKSDSCIGEVTVE